VFPYLDNGPTPPGRIHPWTASRTNPDWQYWDFRLQPELIPEVLEDFKPFERFQAIQTFYAFLRWLNGAASEFESNDSGLRAPKVDDQPPQFLPFERPTVMHGRLAIIFHDLECNSQNEAVDWVKQSLLQCLNSVPKFPSSIAIGSWPHYFSATGKEGHAISLQFWAWGEDSDMAIENLDGCFRVLWECLRRISEHLKSESQSDPDDTWTSGRRRD